MVYDTFVVAISIHMACGRFAAVANLLVNFGGFGFGYFGVVVVIYYSSDVAHAAVAQFNCVFIKNFLEAVRFGQMLVDEGEETFSYIGCYVLGVRGVEPRDVPRPVSSYMWGFTVGMVVVVFALF